MIGLRRGTGGPVGAPAGRLVAVTGAAQGIGLATAEALVRAGALVALGDLDAQLARGEAERLGPSARGFAVDVTDTASFAAFLHDAAEAFGRPLDVLVNNAGVMWVGAFADEPEAAAARQLEVNVHGVIRGMKLVLPGMRARRSGLVVNVASAASRLPIGGEATYSATKHAVLGYSAAVRDELRGSGVRVSVVMPVVVETALAAGTSHGRGPRLAPGDVADAIVATSARPRFEVFVPRALGLWPRVLAVVPQRLRDGLYRAFMPDQLRDHDTAARTEYERGLTGTR